MAAKGRGGSRASKRTESFFPKEQRTLTYGEVMRSVMGALDTVNEIPLISCQVRLTIGHMIIDEVNRQLAGAGLEPLPIYLEVANRERMI